MKATLLLADSAQVADGKLYVLGAGWQFTGPQPGPMAVAVILDVPWDMANQSIRFELQLLDEDGAPVVLPDGGAIGVSGEVEVRRPPGHPPGAPFSAPLALNIQPLPLPPGRSYEWRLSVQDEHQGTWSLPFRVRAADDPS